MKCSLCGREFEEDNAASGCKGCPMTKGCKLIRCPNCGYETPAEPGWIKRLRNKGDKNGTERKG